MTDLAVCNDSANGKNKYNWDECEKNDTKIFSVYDKEVH